ncbi:MAG: hypothetical protein IBX62_00525 [Coriobacteriia bacterium]|nr:hypothetical protein [Coriobacteriia bacterium]
MALADILERIHSDARREAAAMVQSARHAAEERVREAEARAAAEKEAAVSRARAEADAEARTMLAGARLRARDRAVAERRRVVEHALSEAVRELDALPDDAYVALLAAGVARGARGGERVLIAPADAARLDGRLAEAVRAAGGPEVTVAREPAPVERGVMLEGSRMRVEVSPAAMVRARSEELTAKAAEVLFGEEG